MKRVKKWCVVCTILVLLAILLFIRFAQVESVDGALFPGRDTALNWAGGRYELYRPMGNSPYYSLFRWQSMEGESIPTCLSDFVIRFYVSDDYAYIEATEGFMVIDHATHAFPFFVKFSDLPEQHQAVFNKDSLFQKN